MLEDPAQLVDLRDGQVEGHLALAAEDGLAGREGETRLLVGADLFDLEEEEAPVVLELLADHESLSVEVTAEEQLIDEVGDLLGLGEGDAQEVLGLGGQLLRVHRIRRRDLIGHERREDALAHLDLDVEGLFLDRRREHDRLEGLPRR